MKTLGTIKVLLVTVAFENRVAPILIAKMDNVTWTTEVVVKSLSQYTIQFPPSRRFFEFLSNSHSR